MARAVGKNMAAPLLFLNFAMYVVVMSFASWNLNKYINGQTHHPGVAGNGATIFFLIFATLASVVGIASKFLGGNHLRFWRHDSSAAAAASGIVAWAITALAFGLACKEIHIGTNRGWRLRVLEALTIILTFTQLLYLMILHAALESGTYRDTDYPVGAADPKGGGLTGGRV